MKYIKDNYNLQFFEPIIILAFWMILFASPLLFGQYEDGVDWDHIFDVWKNHLPLLALFLIHRFLLMPKLFFKNKKSIYFVFTSVIIISGTLLIYNFGSWKGQGFPHPRDRMERPLDRPSERPLESQRPREMMDRDFPPPMPPGQNKSGPIPAYLNFLTLAILLVGFDAGLQISMRWFGLEQERFKLKKENVENQLAFLRNQISPHFFMNTLNNIHALVDIDSEEAKESIVKLSKLMRHLLYDSEEKRTPIKKEIEFINSYIELMRLRFTNKVEIKVELPVEVPETSIPPLLFTSLLENAFKHGISYNEASYIYIKLSVIDDRLIFSVRNSNHQRKTDSPSGIGVENTKKRLDLLYKDSYTLDISDTVEEFKVQLNIPI